METAVRTSEMDACESLVHLQTLRQRLAALVADAVVACMQTARLATLFCPKQQVHVRSRSCVASKYADESDVRCLKVQ
eukprot:6193396-Pleurochrysis_carterae.AAC.2